MRTTIKVFGIAGVLAASAARGLHAQQKAPTDTASLVGRYEFSLTPRNAETITGALTLDIVDGHWRAVVTSPKLAEPETADEVRVNSNEVVMTMLGGAYTFDFTAVAGSIQAATFTKTMRGTTERGTLSMRKVPAKPQ